MGHSREHGTHAAARRSRGQAYGETDGLWLSNAAVTVLGMRRLVIKYVQERCYNLQQPCSESYFNEGGNRTPGRAQVIDSRERGHVTRAINPL